MGLVTGKYRVIEKDLGNHGSTYENLYGTEATARYFEVKDENLHITMYNPEKVSLSLKKTDMKGTTISNWNFQLNPVDNQGTTATADTAQNGIASFAHIASGTYYLTETGNDAGDYSTKFLNDYLESIGLEDFGTATEGIALGNQTEIKTESAVGVTPAMSQPVVKEVKTLTDYFSGNEAVIKNPQLGSLFVKKTDSVNKVKVEGTDTPKPVKDAVFTIYQKQFGWNDTVTINTSAAPSWPSLGTITTDESGTASKDKLEPGIYYVVETKAPDNYELNSQGQYVVITGGLGVTVTDEAASEGEPGYKESGATLEFTNVPKASLQVTKEVNDGKLTADADTEFTFRLYDAKKGGQQIGKDVTIKAGATGTFANLSLGGTEGRTYWLEEVLPEDGSYALDVDSVTLTRGDSQSTLTSENGRYPIAISETDAGQTLTVDVTNIYLKAKVTILKVNKDDPTVDGLTEATFTITPCDDYGNVAEGAKAEQMTQVTDKGEYEATVTLSSEEGGWYRIDETKAPDGYNMSEEPILVELKPGDDLRYTDLGEVLGNDNKATENELIEGLIMPNTRGTDSLLKSTTINMVQR